MRGTQEYSLINGFYEGQPSAHRSWWHRRQRWSMFELWADQTPLEAVLPGKGEEVVKDGPVGAVGATGWTRQRGGLAEQEVWQDMLQELKQRQKAASERFKAARQERKKEEARRAAKKAGARRREQAARSAAKLLRGERP